MPQWEQVFLAILVSVVAGAMLTAMLFYLLIFPLLNRFFNKSFPCYDYSKDPSEWMDGYFVKDKLKMEVEKAIMPRNNPKINEDKDKTPARFVDVHKDVETVRLPKVVANAEADGKLTVGKIDVAARDITRPTKDATKEYKATVAKPKKQDSPKERAVPIARAEKQLKVEAKDESVKTFELNVPNTAPIMDVKKTMQTKATTARPARSAKPKASSTIETVEIPLPNPDKK